MTLTVDPRPLLFTLPRAVVGNTCPYRTLRNEPVASLKSAVGWILVSISAPIVTWQLWQIGI